MHLSQGVLVYKGALEAQTEGTWHGHIETWDQDSLHRAIVVPGTGRLSGATESLGAGCKTVLSKSEGCWPACSKATPSPGCVLTKTPKSSAPPHFFSRS